MTSELVVRAYNVGFGDAVLVSIPETEPDGTTVSRHLLIDVGNLLAGEGNQDDVFSDVVADIAMRTGGVVDLYIMTHEHLDHVQGLLAAANSGVELKARHAWLTASANPDYYDTHPDARKKRLQALECYLDVVAEHQAEGDPWLELMLRNNGILAPDTAFGLRTADYVDHLRQLAPASRTHYIDRTTKLHGKHPFTETSIRVLAPEEDTSQYYERRTTPSLRVGDGATAAPGDESFDPIVPPVGVDAGAFLDLVRARQHHGRRAILEIDKAANNTSIVLELTWRGWTLLFTGDAEERSWQTMADAELLDPVHLIKVSHHGSINGTERGVFDTILPLEAPDDRERFAIVSTHDDDWESVPDPDTLDLYGARCTLLDTRSVDRGDAVEVRLPSS